MLMLSALSLVVTLIALWVWPAHDPLERVHAHPELPSDHPHLRNPEAIAPNHKHRHAFRIDDLHPHW